MSNLDFTLPGKKVTVGHLHPLTLMMRRIVDFFSMLGFEVVEGPEVETEEYNFDKLNMPDDHPARDMLDTYWLHGSQQISNLKSQISNKSKTLNSKSEALNKSQITNHKQSPNSKSQISNLLLRTHTSPVQLRAMEERQPQVRLIVPGRVFRREATDASHETTFYQCEGLAIDKGIRVTDLIGVLEMLLQSIFGSIKIRVRPSFFPFVEPGLEIDMNCILCQGKGCSVCGQDGWMEMLGAGMVHPQVLKNMKIDPKVYTGFAFGMGIDRLMMLYYGVNDIRLSYSGDLRFVKQF